MKRWTRILRVCSAVALASTTALAQQAPPATGNASGQQDQQATIQRLENQIQSLSGQLQELKEQLEALKEKQQQTAKKAEIEHLRQAALAEATKGAVSESPEVDTTTRFVSGTRMQPQTNPEISFTGNLFVVGGNHQLEEAQAREFEMDVQSYLDPYTRMHLVVSHSLPTHGSSFGLAPGADTYDEGGTEVEEGYITWLDLPGSTTLTVGKKRQQFGVLNRWHSHALDQVDLPWVLQESFGDEGLSGTGVSVDWLMPRLWAGTNELTVEATNGDNDVAFAGSHSQHPTYLARLKSYWDLTKNAYFEVGLNALHGKEDSGGHLDHNFYAADLTYNWYPAGRGLYRDFTLRGMLLRSERDRLDAPQRDAWGGYLYGQLKFSPHWIAGLRYDRVDDQLVDGHRYWGFSPYITFWESEFVRLRGQVSYRKDNWYGIDRRFDLQITFAAGPHKHERY